MLAWSNKAMEQPMTIERWPTTLRFSRRLGEAYPDAEYACALEGPRPGRAYELIHRALSFIRTRATRAPDIRVQRWITLAADERGAR